MDYMGELLRRQRAALTALLLGGETVGKGETDGGTVTEPERAVPARTAETEADRSRSAETGETGRTAQAHRTWGRESSTAAVRTWWGRQTPDGAGAWDTVRPPDRSTVGQTGVREVSRAIQRDARRYDGGFSIY